MPGLRYNKPSIQERVEEARAEIRENDPLPDWTPEQWIAAIMFKLGQATGHLHSDAGTGDWKLGCELLIAVAVVATDAVEQIEGSHDGS